MLAFARNTPSRILRWWLAELSALLPVPLRRGGRYRGHALRIAVERTRIGVSRVDSGRVRELGEASFDDGGELSAHDCERLDAMTARLRPEDREVEIVLAPELSLVKDVELPAAAEENLRQVLGFEMQRFTPFRAADVHYDCEVTERDEGTLRVRLAVVPKGVVDRATKWLSGWVLEFAPRHRAHRESIPLAASSGSLAFVFRDPRCRARRTGVLHASLLALTVVLAAAAVAIPLVHEQRHLDELEIRLDEARRAADAASAVGREVDRLRTEAQFLADRARNRVSLVVLLEELSARLPDSAWVFRLSLSEGQVHLHGSSTAAATLIAVLEDSGRLANVRFASPVVREGGTGRDRFHIAAGIVAPAGGEQ